MSVIFKITRLYVPSTGRPPIEVRDGETPDILSLLMFYFYKPIIFAIPDDMKFLENPEHMGFLLGVAKNVGHEMTFVIQKADNQ